MSLQHVPIAAQLLMLFLPSLPLPLLPMRRLLFLFRLLLLLGGRDGVEGYSLGVRSALLV
jgi:hypothetical protein